MSINIKKLFILLFLIIPGTIYSQTTLSYFEDFENINSSIQLNSCGFGPHVATNKCITNPAFENVESLQFGFRWVNNSSASSPSASFAIDDISLIGTEDRVKYPVHISITGISGVPACANTTISVDYMFSAPLCGNGTY